MVNSGLQETCQNNDAKFRQPSAPSSGEWMFRCSSTSGRLPISSQPTINEKPEFGEKLTRASLKDGSCEAAFKPQMSKTAFKQSTESAFRKPLSPEKSCGVESKLAGPIPSRQVSMPYSTTVGLPRRVEQKQSDVTQSSIQASKKPEEFSCSDKTVKPTLTYANKENNLYNSQRKPDACKAQ